MIFGVRVPSRGLRVEGDARSWRKKRKAGISIHALRVEGDLTPLADDRERGAFLSTPSGWRATNMSPRKRGVGLFLSTPSGWRATLISESYKKDAIDFYPRPPGGGRPYGLAVALDRVIFLSTPSGWRATSLFSPTPTPIGPFLSTPSGWRATAHRSTPAPSCRYFYPRPPGGGRHGIFGIYGMLRPFLSTPSGWRATAAAVAEPAAALDISIHALRVEGDTMLGSACRLKMHFYPRPPGGGRHF